MSMKHIYRLTLVMIAISMVYFAQAQNFHVLDINKAKDANPTNNTLFDGSDWGHADYYYASLNGIAYFSADDGIHGGELWRSDGTAAGTYLVMDILPGSDPSNLRDITVSGGKLYFSAQNQNFEQSIWVSDGTPAGTSQIVDLSLSGSSNPTFLTDVNGQLYFFTDNLNTGSPASQLWKTNGTATGTILVADLSVLNFNQASQLTSVNGSLYFTAIGSTGSELFSYNGTSTGPVLLNTINPYGTGSNASYLTSFKGSLYFSGFDGFSTTLWVSNGTTAGTHAVNNVNNITLDNDPYFHFVTKNNSLYFTGFSNDSTGNELCAYDASSSANSVQVVKAINPGTSSRNMYNMINVNGTIFFTVFNGNDQVLWKSDGTPGGTMQVKDINPGGRNIYLFRNFVNANGLLLFSFYDDTYGYEIWKSDGTPQGTTIVRDINPGVFGSAVTNITYVKKNMTLFEAYDGKTGLELWRTDGTLQGTSLVKQIKQTGTSSSNPVWLTAAPDNQHLIFSAYDPSYAHELRITDGTDAGTSVIKDIFKGSQDFSYPYLPANFGSQTYFFANILDTSVHFSSDIYTVDRFWKTDGTEKGTSIVAATALENFINNIGYVEYMISTSNTLYIFLYNLSSSEQELWRSDGTASGTYPIKTDLVSYYYLSPAVVGNKLFFENFDEINGYTVWESDGSISGTRSVDIKDAVTGITGLSPGGLFVFKNNVFFSAYDSVYNQYLWKSDGTIAGTRIVKQVIVESGFAQVNGKLLFAGYDPNSGIELWASDGSSAGTKLLKDIYPGQVSSFPGNLVSTPSLVFFTAADSAHGYELWKSDGTAKGTQLVKDITPGSDGSYGIENMVAAANLLYFTNNDALWVTNGSAGGTSAVSDAGLANVSSLSNLVAFGSKISFTGYSPLYGSEMWVGYAICATTTEDALPDTMVATREITVANLIYPNPSTGVLNVKISSSIAGRVSVTIMDYSGSPLISKSGMSGGSTAQFNITNFSAGLYFVRITSTDAQENTVLKFIKL
jgi:trimeric autotransporter adhesin